MDYHPNTTYTYIHTTYISPLMTEDCKPSRVSTQNVLGQKVQSGREAADIGHGQKEEIEEGRGGK